MSDDLRQCSRCSRLVPATPLDPIHDCPHGTPCTPQELRRCTSCFGVWRRREDRTMPRVAELTERVRATLEQPTVTLMALGGRARGGVSDA